MTSDLARPQSEQEGFVQFGRRLAREPGGPASPEPAEKAFVGLAQRRLAQAVLVEVEPDAVTVRIAGTLTQAGPRQLGGEHVTSLDDGEVGGVGAEQRARAARGGTDRRGGHPSLDGGGGHRPREGVALRVLDAGHAQGIDDLGRFRPLHDQRAAEPPRQADHAGDEVEVSRAIGKQARETLVELHDVHRQVPDVDQRGVGAADVIEGDADTQRP